MLTSDEEGRRPVALITFAILAAVGLVATILLGIQQPGNGSAPAQPDDSIAASIEDELGDLPGVKDVDVVNSVECINDCSETRRNYAASVSLRPDVTAQQISKIVSTHDAFAPDRVGMAAVPITLALTADKTLTVEQVHYGFGVTQAEAYLAAVPASGAVHVVYGPPANGESPLLSVEASVPGLACSNADAALSQVIPYVSAAATAGGIPAGSVRFDCGAAVLQAGIPAGGPYLPGWSEVATSVDRLCRESKCGEESGDLKDISVAFQDGSTKLIVELFDGKQPDAATLTSLQKIVADLTAAGAVSPQLDLNNY